MPYGPAPPANTGVPDRRNDRCWCAPLPTEPGNGAGENEARTPCRRAARPMMIFAATTWSAAATGPAGGSETSNWWAPYSPCSCSRTRPARVPAVTTSSRKAARSSSPVSPYGIHASPSSAEPSGPTRVNSSSCPTRASRSASASRRSMPRSTPRGQPPAGAPSCSNTSVGPQARPSSTTRSASRSSRSRRSPTAVIESVTAMPPSTPNTSQTGAAPSPARPNTSR